MLLFYLIFLNDKHQFPNNRNHAVGQDAAQGNYTPKLRIIVIFCETYTCLLLTYFVLFAYI